MNESSGRCAVRTLIAVALGRKVPFVSVRPGPVAGRHGIRLVWERSNVQAPNPRTMK